MHRRADYRARTAPRSPEPHSDPSSQQTAEQIGKGGYGVVYRAMKLSTGEVVAMKRFSLRGIAKDELTGIEVRPSLSRHRSP